MAPRKPSQKLASVEMEWDHTRAKSDHLPTQQLERIQGFKVKALENAEADRLSHPMHR